MYTKHFILLGLIFCQFQGFSQGKVKEITAAFPDHGIKMTEQVKNQVDSLYDKLKPGEEVRLKLIMKKEKDLTGKQEINMSSKRSQELSFYAVEKGLHPDEFRVEILHEDKGKSGMGATSNKSYRQFANASVGISEFTLKKSNDYFKPYKHTLDTIGEMKNSLCIDFDPEKGVRVICKEGSVIIIDTNSLVYKNGDKIPNGKTATICVKEFLTLSDITLNGLTTMNNNQMLQTGGMFYISVKSGNDELRMKNGRLYTIIIPADKLEKGMKVFDGKVNHGNMDWNLNDRGTVTNISANDQSWTDDDSQSGMGEGDPMNEYILKAGKFGWINCDKFPADTKKTDLIVSADTSRKVSFNLVYKDIKSVLPGYDYAPDKKVKFENVPSGKEAVIVAFCVSKDKKEVMYAIQEVVPGKENNISLTLTKASTRDFEEKLKAALN